MRLLALALALLTPLTAQDDGTPRRPNVVLLFADDAGYADFGFQDAPAADLAPLTPNIDALARAGARFRQAYVSGPVCSPSRAGLLTGRYQQRFGHERNIPPGYMQSGMSLDESTVADRMRALDYTTGLVGKWHLGYPTSYQPNQRGFDWFYGCLQGSRSYFPMAKPTPHRVIQENGRPTPETGYVTDRLGDAAVRFIEKHERRPFFLFVSFTAPHGPLQAKPDDLAALEHIEGPRRRKYAGLVKALDDAVGTIVTALEANGLTDDTIVVFTNDNGGQTQTGADNAPLRGRKGQLWEGGVRVPMAVRWPGRIAPGTVIDDPVILLDLLPTFVAASGGAIDADWKLDGVDLGPLLTGDVDTLPARDLFWRNHGSSRDIAMRRGDLKLHLTRTPAGSETVSLFDLRTDIGETNDLATDNPDEVATMLEALSRWESELIEPLWGNAPKRKQR